MDSTNYIYLIGIIVLLFFLSYPSNGAALFRPNRVVTEQKESIGDLKDAIMTDGSSFKALVGSDALVFGNNNGIKLQSGKQTVDINKDDIVLSSGPTTSTERMRITGSSGFVGIGTTNPTSLLDVNGAISATDFIVRRNYSVMGNYGIGTTNPLVPLHVSGTTATTTLLADKIGVGISNPLVPLHVSGTASATTLLASDKLGIGNTNPLFPLHVSGTTATSTLLASDRIGIGNTNPLFPLHVSGTASASTLLASDRIGIGNTNPLFPLHVSGTASASTLLASDRIGIGKTNPLVSLDVAGTTLTTKLSVGTTSSTTNLDVHESMHYVGKEFKVGGNLNTYYPVIIDAGMSYMTGKYEFGICRGYVHLDEDWRGVLNFYVEGKPYYCGHAGHYLKWRVTQRPGGPVKYQRMVAGLGEVFCAPEIVVWLLGNTTYYFTGYGCKLKNGNVSGVNLIGGDGNTFSTRATIEPYMDAEVCSGDNLTGIYTLGSRMGLGTSTPLFPFVVNTGLGSYGMVHTDGTVAVGSFVGGSTGGGWFGTKSAHNLSFFTNDSSAQLTIKLGGNVGIGVTDPLQGKLQVAGRCMLGYIPNVYGGVLIDNETAYGTAPCVQSVTNTLNINLLRLNPAGGDVSTGDSLYVGRNNQSNAIYIGGPVGDAAYDHCVIENRLYGGGESTELLLFKGNDPDDRIRLRAGEICFDTHGTYTTNRGAETIRMTINGSGNVGIGTRNPAATLQVWNGILDVHGGGDAWGTNNTYVPGSIIMGDPSRNYYGFGGGLLMQCLDVTEISIHDAGARVVSFMHYNNNILYLGRDIGYGRTRVYMCTYLEVEGDLYANNFYGRSDRRIKKNITPISHGLGSIRLLNPVNYNHVDVLNKDNQLEVGFIAQEVDKVIPEVVSITSDFICDAYDMFTIVERSSGQVTVFLHKPLDWKVGTVVKATIKNKEGKERSMMNVTVMSISGSLCTLNLVEEVDVYGDTIFIHGKKVDDFHMIDYPKLTPVLTKAVQEVADHVDTLQAEVDSLRIENAQLKTTLSSLLQWARLNGFSA